MPIANGAMVGLSALANASKGNGQRKGSTCLQLYALN